MSTEIAWTDETWNPTTGCDRVSPGCDHCYAMTLAKRLKAMGQAKYQNDGDPRTSGPGFGVTCHPDALDIPLRWRKPRLVFVNSMSDLFHKDVPENFIVKVFGVMIASGSTFQVLTKRPQRMAQIVGSERFEKAVYREVHDVHQTHMFAGWPYPTVWLGTSVEDQRYAGLRIPHLLATPAAVRFLSIEPLLGPVTLCRCDGAAYGPQAHPFIVNDACPLHGAIRVDWVIVGGESGPGARPMEREWAESIVEQCQAAGVPVFVKQLGTVLGGKRHADVDTFPASLQVREFPSDYPVKKETK